MLPHRPSRHHHHGRPSAATADKRDRPRNDRRGIECATAAAPVHYAGGAGRHRQDHGCPGGRARTGGFLSGWCRVPRPGAAERPRRAAERVRDGIGFVDVSRQFDAWPARASEGPPDAAGVRQLRARDRGSRRNYGRRVVGRAGCAHPGNQPGAAARGGRARAPGSAIGQPGVFGGPDGRGGIDVPRHPAVRRTRGGVASQRLRTARCRCADRCGDLPAAGRDRAGDRAGGWLHGGIRDPRAGRAARRSVQPAETWAAHGAAAAPDARRNARLELSACCRRTSERCCSSSPCSLATFR